MSLFVAYLAIITVEAKLLCFFTVSNKLFIYKEERSYAS